MLQPNGSKSRYFPILFFVPVVIPLLVYTFLPVLFAPPPDDIPDGGGTAGEAAVIWDFPIFLRDAKTAVPVFLIVQIASMGLGKRAGLSPRRVTVIATTSLLIGTGIAFSPLGDFFIRYVWNVGFRSPAFNKENDYVQLLDSFRVAGAVLTGAIGAAVATAAITIIPRLGTERTG